MPAFAVVAVRSVAQAGTAAFEVAVQGHVGRADQGRHGVGEEEEEEETGRVALAQAGRADSRGTARRDGQRQPGCCACHRLGRRGSGEVQWGQARRERGQTRLPCVRGETRSPPSAARGPPRAWEGTRRLRSAKG
jgi:hypothetical protein